MGTFFSALKGQPCLGSKEHLGHFSFPLWPSCAESVLAQCCEHSTATDVPARCSRLQREGAWRDGASFPLTLAARWRTGCGGRSPGMLALHFCFSDQCCLVVSWCPGPQGRPDSECYRHLTPCMTPHVNCAVNLTRILVRKVWFLLPFSCGVEPWQPGRSLQNLAFP